MNHHDATDGGSAPSVSSETPHANWSARRLATRERLLDAASAVFAEGGMQGASVEAICARAGFTRGAFYSNFDTKEQLFLALLRREMGRQAEHLRTQAAALEPVLRASDCGITATDAASYIAEFFLPVGEVSTTFALEVEFLMLALRDATIAPEYHRYIQEFTAEISAVIGHVIAAAGRRFVLPVERAVPVLGDLYERALRTSVLAGPDATGGLDELSENLAELLFALTETIQAPAP